MNSWFQRHTRSILFLFVALAVAGGLSSVSLPVALFPDVRFPRLRISLDAGDRPAEAMLIEVTRNVEEAVRAIPGVVRVRSTTSRGSAEINVNFQWGEDMIAAMLQAESEVNRALPNLPQGTTFSVQRMNPTVFPVICYSLTSNTHSPTELHDLAYYTLRPSLSTISGVAKVDVLGGKMQEYQVVVDPGKLQAYNLAITDVANAVSASNVLVAVGRLQEYDKLYLIVSDTRIKGLDDLGRTIVHSGPNGVVQLSDVATIEDSAQPQWTRVTADGHDAVLFQVYQQPGGNTVQIASGIKEKIAVLQKQIPPDVKIANWYDQSDLIVASADSTRDAVLIGIGLASIVLLLFLRNLKVTVIAAVAVASTLAATILLLAVLHMSFNIMTLGGIAAAVGLIIDDSIVMIEHMVRRLREKTGENRRLRIANAAAEFTRPLCGSSAATIIIFAPLAFLSDVTGAFFKALSLTMASGLIISFLIAWLVVPILSGRLLSDRDAETEEGGGITRSVHRLYTRIMEKLLRRPVLILLVIIPLLLVGFFAFQHVASGFMPSMDEGGFIIDYKTPPGTSLVETDRLLRQVESILQSIPETQTYSRRTGIALGGDINEANSGDFFVRLKKMPRRSIDAVMEDLRQQVETKVPGITFETAQLMEDLIGDLTSVPQPIEIKLYTEDQAQLQDLARKVADAVSKVPGVIEVKNGIVPAGDALNISVDRAKAAIEGVDPDSISKTLNGYVTGNVTTNIQHGPKLIGVRVRLPEASHETQRELGRLMMRATDGHLFPLGRVAKITSESGQPEIMREDLQRMLAVTARISGRDLGSTVNDVKKILDQPGLLPKSVPYSLGGLYEQQQIAFQGLTIILISAVVLVFVLLLFLYESFHVAISILVTTLLAVAAVYIGLWITGTEFNITSRMGMTMVVGIVTEVGIFYYSELREIGSVENRHILAGTNRMRPIAMTTFAAILALLPLALGIGQGSAMQQPLAIAIISGLVFQLPLALVVLPVLLSLGKSKTDVALQH
jgi:CzcA family heavy metal efflux pump